jgi:hypothetical protein
MTKSKKSDKQAEVKVDEMRQSLKELMKREIANLPDLIEQLPPEQRINMVFKLMPFVLPKVNTVHPKSGEARDLFADWGTYD